MNEIIKRKQEHLKIAQEEAVQYSRLMTSFEGYRFIHNALPELDFKQIDTRTSFLEYRLSAPLMIAGMTGGDDRSERLNRDLARAAREMKIALGLGSIRPLLEDCKQLSSYKVAKEEAPDVPVIANIGAVQLLRNRDTSHLIEVLKSIKVDALAIHLNPLQEALQPEGEPQFRGVSRAIELLKETIPFPLIVKEVGFGLSENVIARLYKIGIRWIDIAGAGGTCWSRIEAKRARSDMDRQVAAEFFEWGIPTAVSLEWAVRKQGLQVIASGGIDSGLSFAKAIALGAHIGAAASPFLKAWSQGGVAAVRELIRVFTKTLRIAMFCTGCHTLPDFRGNRQVISRENDD